MCILSPVRELQQDVRELNQADLPEVDPEENSAEFMGILIKVHTGTLLSTTHTVNLLILLFKCIVLFSSGFGQVEENPRDHQSHYGATGARAETDRQEIHNSDSGPRLPERRKPGPGESAKVG